MAAQQGQRSQQPYPFDENQLRAFLAAVMDPAAGCYEVRVFDAVFNYKSDQITDTDGHSGVYAAWFTDPDVLVAEVRRVRRVSPYIIPNPVNPTFMATDRANRIRKGKTGELTNDNEIVFLRWLFLDIDYYRGDKKISSTDAELGAAVDRRDAILAAHPEMVQSSIWGTSGNGAWVLIRLPDYPNDEGHRGLLARALDYFRSRFDGDGITIDRKCKNPSRLMCLPGTLKCKGRNVITGPEGERRPWRLARFETPGKLPVPFDLKGWTAEHRVPDKESATVAPGVNVNGSNGAVRATTTGHPGGDRAAMLDRARRYLAAIPGAISGQGGHDQTFDAACALFEDYDLSVEEASVLLREYNGRCMPPWSDAELEHKIRDANDKPYPVRGRKLGQDRPGWMPEEQYRAGRNGRADGGAGEGGDDGEADAHHDDVGPVFKLPDDPHRLARLYLQTRHRHPHGHTLYFWQEEFFEWNGYAYRVKPRAEVRADLTNFVEDEFNRLHVAALRKYRAKQGDGGEKPPKCMKVTTGVVIDTMQALTGLILLEVKDYPDQPVWLGIKHPWPPNEILPTRNLLIHMPSLVGDGAFSSQPSPLFFARYAVDHPFIRDAPEPEQWLVFLHSLWPDDPQSIVTLQEWMGHLLIPDTSLQKIAMLIGPRRSGKGTIVRVIRELIGPDNMASPTLASLATNFGLAPLIGKLTAVIADARISGRTDIAVIIERLLSISGEDAHDIDRKYREAIATKLSARFMLVSNELPKLRDMSGALVGRMVFLQLTESFLGKEDTTLFDKKLKPEMPQILAWAVRGWESLKRRGHFVQPKAAEDLLTAMENLTSPVKAWLRDCCVIGKDELDPIADLFTSWKSWCTSKEIGHPGDEETFGRNLRAAISDLKRIRPSVGGERVWHYRGLRLLERGEETGDRFDDNDELIREDEPNYTQVPTDGDDAGDGYIPF